MKFPTWIRHLAHPYVGRGLWALMLVGHTPALWKAWGGGAAAEGEPYILSALLLTLTQAFFALKVLDVRWLRLPTTRRAWITAAIAVALLHSGVVLRIAEHGLADSAGQQAVLLTTCGALISSAVTLAALLIGRIYARTLRRRARSSIAQRLAFWLQWWIPPRYLLLTRACSVNRAPPR